MSLPFIKVRCSEWLDRASLVGWTLDNRAPVLWVDMDLAILTASGRLDDLSVRDLAKRWGWPRSTAARKVKEGVGRIWDSSGTLVGQERDTPTKVEPAQLVAAGTDLGQERDSSGTHARSSLESRREEREERTPARQPKADGSIPFPGQDKPAPVEKTEAEKGLDILREIRTEHHQAATGSKPRGVYCSSGKAKAAMLVRVKRYLGEVKGAQYGEPLEVLRTYAEWVYLGPDSFWRATSDPLGQALGGKANDPTNRLARTVAALDWQDAGGGTLPRVREMVAGLEGLVKKHAYLVHAVEGEPEEVAEQFKGLLETATGIDRTEVWARMRAANAWQFGKWAEAARATL